MKLSFIVLLVVVSMAVSGAGAFGAINPILNYQGSLTDSAGTPYADGVHQLIFSIYADSIGGSALWTETLHLELKHGLVHAYLGETQPFPIDLFETYPLYLGIVYESQPEFAPRHLIASSVYTFLARNSQNLGGFPAEHFADSSKLASSITAHNADPTAHHPMQIDAAEVVSGVLDPNRLPPLTVDSLSIKDGGIATADLSDSLVTGAKIAAAAVNGIHLADNAVTSGKILDGSLSGDDLADSAVTSGKIATGAIHSEHLSVSAFTGGNIADGTITGVDLADSTVTGSKIASGSIQNQHLSISAFTGDNIADGTITAVDFADSTITGDKIGSGQVRGTHLANNSIDGSKLAEGSITGAKIYDGSIMGNDVGNGAIAGSNIANATITGGKIVNGTITGTQIQDGSIAISDLGPSSVGTVQIMDNSITTDDISDNTITAADCKDEPGLDYAGSALMSSVGTTIVNWMNLTVSAPASGYIIAFFNSVASISNNEIAQASISTTPTTFGAYGEARITSNATATGANMTITISDVIPVAAAGDVVIYANVRAGASSAGTVDFFQGRLQVIFIRTAY